MAFFQTLGASTIAEVARLLRPRDYAAGAVIVRRGEPGDCMYFVASGEVEIEIDPEPFRLDIAEFRELRSRQPDLARVIYDAAHRRLGAVGAERMRERETVGEFSASC